MSASIYFFLPSIFLYQPHFLFLCYIFRVDLIFLYNLQWSLQACLRHAILHHFSSKKVSTDPQLDTRRCLSIHHFSRLVFTVSHLLTKGPAQWPGKPSTLIHLRLKIRAFSNAPVLVISSRWLTQTPSKAAAHLLPKLPETSFWRVISTHYWL